MLVGEVAPHILSWSIDTFKLMKNLDKKSNKISRADVFQKRALKYFAKSKEMR